jgi:hypothetical protein
VSCVLTVMLTVALVTASEGLALAAPPFRNRGLAIVNGDVLWFDEGALLLQGPHLGVRRLWASSSFEDGFSSITSFATLHSRLSVSADATGRKRRT